MKKSVRYLFFLSIVAAPAILSQLVMGAPKVGVVLAALLGTGGGGELSLFILIGVFVVASILGLLEGSQAFKVALF